MDGTENVSEMGKLCVRLSRLCIFGVPRNAVLRARNAPVDLRICGKYARFMHFAFSAFSTFNPYLRRVRNAEAGGSNPLISTSICAGQAVLGTGLLACLGARCGNYGELCRDFVGGFSALRFLKAQKKTPEPKPGGVRCAARKTAPCARLFVEFRDDRVACLLQLVDLRREPCDALDGRASVDAAPAVVLAVEQLLVIEV